MTVDGVPGSSPPSTRGSDPGADLRRDLVEPAGVGPAGEIRARRDDGSESLDDLGGGPLRAGTRTPIVSGRPPESQLKRRAGFGRRA